MDAVVLQGRGGVDLLRRAIARTRVLVEPRASEWCESDASDAFDWTASAPLTGAKRWFFPPHETVLRWGSGGVPHETLPVVVPFALFGLRP